MAFFCSDLLCQPLYLTSISSHIFLSLVSCFHLACQAIIHSNNAFIIPLTLHSSFHSNFLPPSHLASLHLPLFLLLFSLMLSLSPPPHPFTITIPFPFLHPFIYHSHSSSIALTLTSRQLNTLTPLRTWSRLIPIGPAWRWIALIDFIRIQKASGSPLQTSKHTQLHTRSEQSKPQWNRGIIYQ